MGCATHIGPSSAEYLRDSVASAGLCHRARASLPILEEILVPTTLHTKLLLLVLETCPSDSRCSKARYYY